MDDATRLSLGRSQGLQRLVRGVNAFRAGYFASHRALFAQLAEGQTPHTLFVSCSDSRVMPDLITNAAPGELFALRDVGNIVPGAGREAGASAGAALEYAVCVLGVRNIIVCGHTSCGAVEAILNPASTAELSYVPRWLAHAKRLRSLVEERYPELTGDDRVVAGVEENVLMQLENVCTYDFVAERLDRGALKINGWVFKIATGEVFDYDPTAEQFVKLSQA